MWKHQNAVLHGFRNHGDYVSVHAIGEPKHYWSNDWWISTTEINFCSLKFIFHFCLKANLLLRQPQGKSYSKAKEKNLFSSLLLIVYPQKKKKPTSLLVMFTLYPTLSVVVDKYMLKKFTRLHFERKFVLKVWTTRGLFGHL